MAVPPALAKHRRSLAKFWLTWRWPLIGVVVLVIVAGGANYGYQSWVESAREASQREAQAAAQAAVGAIRASIVGQIEAAQALLVNDDLAAAFASGDAGALHAKEQALPAGHPSVLGARLLVPGTSQTDYDSNPPLTFASLDLVNRSVETGKDPALEVLLFGEKEQHIAMVRRVTGADGALVGHVLLALSVDLLPAAVQSAPLSEGYVELMQPAPKGKALVLGTKGDASRHSGVPSVTLPVKGSTWRVAYWPEGAAAPVESESSGLPLPLLGAAAGALILGGGAFVALRRRRKPAATTAETPRVAEPSATELSAKLAAIRGGDVPPPAEVESDLPVVEFSDDDEEPAAAAAATPDAAAPAGAAPAAEGGGDLPESIFRAYDVRGVVDKTLTADIVRKIGRAIGSEAYDRGQQALAVGCDGRLSSPALKDALVEGLRMSGRDVIDVGQVPTPLLYYATHYLNTGSGVMVTGSHNPPEYNGLKIMLGGDTLFGDDITALRTRIVEDQLASGQGNLQDVEVVDEYIRRVSEDIPVALGSAYKVALDCGNGIAGAVAPKLIRALGHDVVEVHCEVDGTFPNHHPDPSDPANLADLIKAVKDNEADIGFAFDGDGDRLGVVDAAGNIVWPDRQLMLFAVDVLSRNPGAEIVFDVKCSNLLGKVIAAKGGKPVMSKTGHSFIKNKLKESGAPLAGEMSGHLFFAERWYGFDDALYAAARMLEIFMKVKAKPTAVLSKLPAGVSTPELRLDMQEGQHHAFMERLAQGGHFSDGKVTTIDGIRVDYPDAWGLVRASNTTPSLVLRFEGKTQESLERVQEQFRSILLELDSGLELPF